MKYNAFISYPQDPDKNLAVAIQNGLRKLGAKKHLLQFRALQIFRDETDFSGHEDLKSKIEKGLDDSEYLVVLASPKIAYPSTTEKRNWIEEEIKYWIKTKHAEEYESRRAIKNLKIIICITNGEINWDFENNDFDWQKTTCLPPVLEGKFEDIPLWVDFRNIREKENNNQNVLSLDFPEFKQKVAEISSKIQNVTVDQLISKDIGRNRIWKILLSVVGVLLLGLSIFAFWMKREADISRENTEQQLKISESLRLASDATGLYEKDHTKAARLAQVAYELNSVSSPLSVLQTICKIYYDSHFEKLPFYNKKIKPSFDRISAIAVSPDDNKLVVSETNRSGDNAVLNIWSLEKDSLLVKLIGHREEVGKAVFMSDSKKVLTGSVDATAKLWSAETGELLRSFDGHRNSVYGLSLSSDEKYLLTGSFDSTAILWALESGDSLYTFNMFHNVDNVAFSAENDTIIIESEGTIYLYDFRTKKQIHSFEIDSYVLDFKMSKNPNYLLIGGEHAEIWNIHEGKSIYGFPHTEDVVSVEYSQNENYILTGSRDGFARLWDKKGNTTLTFKEHLNEEVSSALFLNFSDAIITSGLTEIRQWDLKRKGLKTYKKHGCNDLNYCGVNDVKFTPDNKMLISGGDDRLIWLYSHENDKPIKSLKGHQYDIYSLSISNDGRFLASSGGDSYNDTGEVIVWDLHKDSILFSLKGFKSAVHNVSFSPSEKSLLLSCSSGIAKLWSLESDEEIYTFSMDSNVYQATFSPDGQRILIANGTGEIEIWSLDKLKIAEFELPDSLEYYDLISYFSPDGKTIVAAGGNAFESILTIWDIASQQIIHTKSFEGSIDQLSFSPNGEFLLGIYENSFSGYEVKLWQTSTMEEVMVLKDVFEVTGIDFASNGLSFATCNRNGKVQTWYTPSGIYDWLTKTNIYNLSKEDSINFGISR